MNSPRIKDLFSRNIFIISPEEQMQFEKIKLGFFGVGMGSVVSELATRMGFSNIFIADGDVVEPSNLNRQNYTLEDCGHKKVSALEQRLKLINPAMNLEVYPQMLDRDKLNEVIPRMDYIYNFIDWDNDDFLHCHNLCREYKKIEFFTINLGFTSACMVITQDSPSFEEYFGTSDVETIKSGIISLAAKSFSNESDIHQEIQNYTKYSKYVDYDPQVALASYMSAWQSIRITIESLRNHSRISVFPHVYIIDIEYSKKSKIANAA